MEKKFTITEISNKHGIFRLRAYRPGRPSYYHASITTKWGSIPVRTGDIILGQYEGADDFGSDTHYLHGKKVKVELSYDGAVLGF